MKVHVSVVFLLALALAAHALIKDSSILEEETGCESKLVVKVAGFGTDMLETEARILCKEECDKGVQEFKDDRCSELCGMLYRNGDDDGAEVCNLCQPDPDKDIDRCISAMVSAVRRCKRGCQNNRARTVTDGKRVSSNSGTIKVPFKSTTTN